MALSLARWNWRRSILTLAVIAAIGLKARAVLSRPPPFAFDETRPYAVQRVIDGDTLLIEGGVRVRLLGVNTPETRHPDRPVEPWGEEAAEFARRWVGGAAVHLRFDRERLDRFDRVLAYVFLGQDCLNERLIRAGFSRAETRFPFSEAMKRRFRDAEAAARAEHVGIWSTPP